MTRLPLLVSTAHGGTMAPAARGATILVLLLASTSCRSREMTAEGRDAALPGAPDGGSPTAKEGAFATRKASSSVDGSTAAGAPSSAPIDALGTIYPHDAPPHPLATRLCDALHAFPARRKSECCGGEPAPLLATECARVLAATLHADTAVLEEAAVERCAAAMTESLAGCAWVTPSTPPAPEACQGLLRGKLERGAVCRSSLECAGEMHCEGVSPTKTGVCTPPGGDGAGCGAHVDVLATYLFDRHLPTTHPFCAEHCSLVAHKCGQKPMAGSACVANVNCAPSQMCVTGRCSATEPRQKGEACGAVACAQGLRCVAKVCAPLAGTGETCTSDMDCAMGGCVRGDDGGAACGAKCVASLDALRGAVQGKTMRLPTVPHASDAGRR